MMMYLSPSGLKRLRFKLGLTKRELANKLRVVDGTCHRDMVKDWEDGRPVPARYISAIHALTLQPPYKRWRGAEIFAMRKRLLLSRTDLAEMCGDGVDIQVVRSWERDLCLPSKEISAKLQAIAELEPPRLSWSAELLKETRMLTGLSMEKLANYVGCNETTWYRWEQGQVPINRKRAVLEALDRIRNQPWTIMRSTRERHTSQSNSGG